MSEDNLAGDLSGDDSAAAADDAAAAELDAVLADVSDEDVLAALDADDDLDFAANEGDEQDIAEVADLLAGALISGSSQASAAALEAYNRLGRAIALGGPLKAALPEAEEAPVEEEQEQEQAGLA